MPAGPAPVLAPAALSPPQPPEQGLVRLQPGTWLDRRHDLTLKPNSSGAAFLLRKLDSLHLDEGFKNKNHKCSFNSLMDLQNNYQVNLNNKNCLISARKDGAAPLTRCPAALHSAGHARAGSSATLCWQQEELVLAAGGTGAWLLLHLNCTSPKSESVWDLLYPCP